MSVVMDWALDGLVTRAVAVPHVVVVEHLLQGHSVLQWVSVASLAEEGGEVLKGEGDQPVRNTLLAQPIGPHDHEWEVTFGRSLRLLRPGQGREVSPGLHFRRQAGHPEDVSPGPTGPG